MRDEKGQMIIASGCSFTSPLDTALAKAISVREAVSWLKNSPFRNIIFETDSLYVYEVLNSQQSAFVPNRLIIDNITISYEINHFLKRKTRGKTSYGALKAYMSRACVRVEWKFLEQIMHAMGFPEKWIRWVMMCTTSV